MDFCSTHVFSAKKVRISQLVGLFITGYIVTHSVQIEQTLGHQLYNGLQDNESCDATSHAELSPTPTLVA
jgi:hypothetical protein